MSSSLLYFFVHKNTAMPPALRALVKTLLLLRMLRSYLVAARARADA